MIKMAFPVVLIVFSNVFYNLSTKFTPSQANSFLSLTVTYITAAVLSFASFLLTSNTKNMAVEFSKLNDDLKKNMFNKTNNISNINETENIISVDNKILGLHYEFIDNLLSNKRNSFLKS